jgi:threonine aldolase
MPQPGEGCIFIAIESEATMSEVTRRQFVELGGLAGGGLAAGAAPAGPASNDAGARSPGVDLAGDGVPLAPGEYVALLARLTQQPGFEADEYSRGGAVALLEAQFAALLGKETAVFMPSGTLANHLAVRALAGPKRRVVVQEASHLYNDSGDCAQQLSQLNLVPLAPGEATFGWDEVARLLERTASSRVATGVGAISIESPVRRLHHAIFDYDEMKHVSAGARERGIRLHLDGARLFVAAAYSGRSPAEYAALFDTVYVSLWKCFNSASGAILAGPRAVLDDMYHARRMFGGALWGAWPHAAVARHYAEGYLGRLREAASVAEQLLGRLAADPAFKVTRVPNGTSGVRLEVVKSADLPAYAARLRARGITLPPPDGTGFWLRVNETLRGASAATLASAFRAALTGD